MTEQQWQDEYDKIESDERYEAEMKEQEREDEIEGPAYAIVADYSQPDKSPWMHGWVEEGGGLPVGTWHIVRMFATIEEARSWYAWNVLNLPEEFESATMMYARVNCCTRSQQRCC